MIDRAPRHAFFVPCIAGIEALLHAEVRALRLAHAERQVGGVYFEGTLQDAWRANLELRTGSRVLLRVARFDARDERKLYAGARAVEWSQWLRPGATLRVNAHTRASELAHTVFIAQRVKDAIADEQRESRGARPDVDLSAPDITVHAQLTRNRCTLLVDTSGPALYRRGWRREQGRAPLAETLAAAMVLASGWNLRSPLIDPFCGSGTILVEAALLASGTAPGLLREEFALRKLPDHDESAWQALREKTRARITWPARLILRGADADTSRLKAARENLLAAGLDERVELERADARAFAPRHGWNAWIVTNPPWGERVGNKRELAALYTDFGRILRKHAHGYHLALLCGAPRLLDALGITFDSRIELRYGGLDCSLVQARLPD